MSSAHCGLCLVETDNFAAHAISAGHMQNLKDPAKVARAYRMSQGALLDKLYPGAKEDGDGRKSQQVG